MDYSGEFGSLVRDGKSPLEVAHLFWDSACAYVDTDGDKSVLVGYFGSIGQFLSCGDGFADWLYQLGLDPYPFWDMRLGLEYHIDDPESIALPEIARLIDRAVLCLLQSQVIDESPPRSASAGKLWNGSPPPNPDIVDLVSRIDGESGSGRSWSVIAREFTEGDEPKAKSLLASIRRYRRMQRVNLDCEH